MAWARTAEQVAEHRAIAIKRREPNGRAQRKTTRSGREQERQMREHETEEQAMRVALGQPHRTSLPKTRRDDEGRRVPIEPRDPRAGFALGRLFLHDTISRDQLIAGQRFTEIALRHMQHITGHLPKFPSQAINDTVKGLACTADMSDDEAMTLRRSWSEAQRALVDTNDWQACSSALGSICVMDRDPRGDAELGALRVGLNALHRLWQ